MKLRWLNLILHLSSISYRKKKALFSAQSWRMVLLMIEIFGIELLIALTALPFYFFVGADKTKIPRNRNYQIKIYRLRRRLTLAAFVVFVLLLTGNVIFGFLSFTSYPEQSQAALNSGITRVGKYEGDGTKNRTIDNVGFQPDAVMIKAEKTNIPILKTMHMSGNVSKPLVTWTGLTENLIQSLNEDGFTIGSDQRVNEKGKIYYWAAFKKVDDIFQTGTYIGNGQEQNIAGIGFSPEYVMVLAENGNLAVHRSNSMDKSYFIEGDQGSNDRITGFTPDGFTVGNSSATNSEGVTYFYLVWRNFPGIINSANRLVKILTEPALMWGK